MAGATHTHTNTHRRLHALRRRFIALNHAHAALAFTDLFP
jgi:hypothetical protein